MAATLTIAGVQYIMIEDQFDQTNALSERQRLKCDVIDYTGTAHWQKGNQVVVTDPVLGVIFNGYLYTDKEVPQYPSGAILHSIDCIDQHYLADKRTYTRTYDTPEPAGKIVVDMLHDVLSQEGIAQNYALHTDSTATDFSQGILSSTISAANIGDGNLELTPAGSNLTITESTTADFSTGTLTNVVAANNSLAPSKQSALKASVFLPGGGSGAFLSLKIWTGSLVIGTNDMLNYDVWITDTSPEQKVAIDILCSDGTVISTLTNVYDQNFLLAAPATDLSSYANDAWYTRNITLIGLNGKTITTVLVSFAGTSPGTYTAYFKNIYLGSASGTPFLSTSATVTNVNPPRVYQFASYFPSTLLALMVSVFDPATASRVSPAHSIDAVKLLQGSTVSWTGANTSVEITYDGISYLRCTNNAALPALPVGSNVTGLSLTIKETFTVGTDPTLLPILASVVLTLNSAPNATKSDVVTTFSTQSQFNTGTYSNTTANANGDLLLAPIVRDWGDNLITGQTFFNSVGATQAASGGVYTISAPTNGGFGMSRLDLAGQMIDFIIDIDLKVGGTTSEAGVTYRQISWVAATNNTFGYYVGICSYSPSFIEIGHGSNGTTDSFTQIAIFNTTITPGTTYHVKIVVNGTHHQVYFNNSTIPTLDIIDTFCTQAGNVGLRCYNINASTQTSTFDNFVLRQASSGTWASPSTSISSLGTCGSSMISWTETNTSTPVLAYDVVQTSVDGGSTYQICTNQQAIPNLPSGTNVSGKSVLVKVTLGSQTNIAPMISGLVWRVLGQYPGSSGTRTTAPMALDMMTRANQSGLGTTTDGQTYTITGTGTESIASNHALIVSTGTDTHAQPGMRTGTDEDIYCQINIGNSGDIAGIEGRYSAASGTSAYKLLWYSGALHLNKSVSGTNTTLATSSAFVMTPGTWYVFHLRITGSTTASLQGRAWQVGALEPTTWNITATD